MIREDEMTGYDQDDYNNDNIAYNAGMEEEDDYSTSLDDESDDEEDATYSDVEEDDYQDDLDDTDVDEDDAVNDDISESSNSQAPTGNPVYIKDMPPIEGSVRQVGL